MKFKFSLESVLKHRKRQEEEAYRAFVESKNALDEAQRILKEMYAKVDQSREKIAALQTRSAKNGLSEILQNESFIQGQGLRIRKHREKMRELQLDLEEKQEALVLALRERKTLEKLKERKKREHDMEVARREALEMDEIATIRAGGRN